MQAGIKHVMQAAGREAGRAQASPSQDMVYYINKIERILAAAKGRQDLLFNDDVGAALSKRTVRRSERALGEGYSVMIERLDKRHYPHIGDHDDGRFRHIGHYVVGDPKRLGNHYVVDAFIYDNGHVILSHQVSLKDFVDRLNGRKPEVYFDGLKDARQRRAGRHIATHAPGWD